VEATSGGKDHRINALASEIVRHQQVRKSADLGFNSNSRRSTTVGPSFDSALEATSPAASKIPP
jgi:hypothetical protein